MTSVKAPITSPQFTAIYPKGVCRLSSFLAQIGSVKTQIQNTKELKADSYCVLHFAPQFLDDIISKFRRHAATKREQFQDTFYAMDLIHENLWLKERKELPTGKCSYSLKEITLSDDPYIGFTEETDKQKIEERIGKRIEDTEAYAILHVTRWSQAINGVYFYIDSSRSERHKTLEVNDWYLSCGCRAKDWDAIENCFQQLEIQKETLVYPTPSVVIDYLQEYFPDEVDELKLLSELEDEDTRIYHRRADPLDMNLTLPVDASKEEVATWCNRIADGKFAEEFQKITEGLDGEYLYGASPQHIILRGQERGVDVECGTALYFYIHLWQSPMRCSVKELIALAQEDTENIYRFTLYEIQMMQQECSELKEIYEESGEQGSLLVELQNIFVQCQLKHNVSPVFL